MKRRAENTEKSSWWILLVLVERFRVFPFFVRFFVFGLAGGGVCFFSGLGVGMLSIFLFLVCATGLGWGVSLVFFSFEGKGGFVNSHFRFGFLLFLLSETFFFFSFFWRFFHCELVPRVEFGGVFPPFGIFRVVSFGVPFLNTVVLLSSGVAVTLAHKEVLEKGSPFFSLFFTFLLGCLFLFFQFKEYRGCGFSFSDRVFGRVFYILTGFHGFHVFLGSFFLLLCSVFSGFITSFSHVFFQCSV
ncbi:MAG: cytochrome c oxidase subunit 3 [Ignavibacteria bacterium]|nr:MAG: cytochrome c oxidase subunit 3 [Ignavibacteria bacterium]